MGVGAVVGAVGVAGGGALTSLDALSLTLPLWPAAVALALAALATVFRYGAALETQTAALRRDTEGLV